MIFNQPNAIDFAAIGRPAFGQAATHLPAAPTAAQVRANVRYVRSVFSVKGTLIIVILSPVGWRICLCSFGKADSLLRSE